MLNLLKLFIGVASLCLSLQANAFVIDDSVSISELFNPNIEGGLGAYSVTNNISPDKIFAFAVGNDNTTDAATAFKGGSWNGMVVDQATWDTFATGIGLNLGTSSFSVLFPGFSTANLYAKSDIFDSSAHIHDGEVTGLEFFFHSPLVPASASPFAALYFKTIQGGIGVFTGKTTTSVVPVPGAAILFATGLIALASRARIQA